MCKLFDIRNLKEEIQSFRGHKKDACSKFIYFYLEKLWNNKKTLNYLAVEWHPIYEKVFASGGADGSLFFWHVG